MSRTEDSGKLPAYVSYSEVFHVLENPTYLKTHDWHLLLGPLGKWILYGVINADYESVFFPYMDALGLASSVRKLSTADVDFLVNEIRFSMANLEHNTPEYFCNLNRHNMLHMVENIAKFGPSHAYSMFRREMLHGRLAAWKKQQTHPETTIMLSYRAMRIGVETVARDPNFNETSKGSVAKTATGEARCCAC